MADRTVRAVRGMDRLGQGRQTAALRVDEKAVMCGSVGDIVRPRLNHRVDVQSGVEAEACAELIKGSILPRRRGFVCGLARLREFPSDV